MMGWPRKSLRKRPDRKRVFTREEDQLILSWVRGEITLTFCWSSIDSSAVAVKRRATQLCEGTALKVPSHKNAKKSYPKYQGLDGDPIDTADFRATVGIDDPLLARLQAGLR